MTTEATDLTAMRGKLFAILGNCWSLNGIVDAILTEFPEIGQQPRLDPALRERIDEFEELIATIAESWDDELLPSTLAEIILAAGYRKPEDLAPAAQPLPTRSELLLAFNGPIGWRKGSVPSEDRIINILIAAGYATEDDPEPQAGEVVTLRQRTREEREFYMIAKYAELERRVRDLESKFPPPPDKAGSERGGS